MNPKKQLITFKKVWFGYNHQSKNIISDLSIDIYDQSIITILGLNGSGKTTMMLLLLGLESPQKGEILFLGEEENPRMKKEMNIGYIPQYEEIPLGFTVYEYVLLGRIPFVNIFSRPSNYDREIALNILDELNIYELRESNLSKISGGELQKVRIARVLTQQPDLLLLDEPTTHLDLKSKWSIQEILINQKKQGKTIVFTTHDASEAVDIADYVMLMKKGKRSKFAIKNKVMTEENLSYYLEVPMEIIYANKHKIILQRRAEL